MSARIIKNSYSKARNFLLLDKGEADGIKSDFGVISNDGIIGIVNQTTEDFSSVLSLLHRDLKVNVSFKGLMQKKVGKFLKANKQKEGDMRTPGQLRRSTLRCIT